MSVLDPLAKRYTDDVRIVSASGAWLIDQKGRSWLDMVLGSCCQVHGHCHPYITEKIVASVRTMTNVGDRVTADLDPLANRILRHTQKECLRFVSSGSEAVQVALRAARASYRDKRSKLIRFTGHYHGWLDHQITKFTPERYSKFGIDLNILDDTIQVEWNNPEALERAFRTFGEQAYAAICEPTLCHSGTIPAMDGFLGKLRELCDRYGVRLIFDECITGFRLGLGGAQAHYGVTADASCYSKTLSAGIPLGIACLSGPCAEEFEHERAYQAATFDGNAVAVGAATAVLDLLEQGEFYETTKLTAAVIQSGMSQILAKHGVAHCFQGHSQVFQIFITEQRSIRSWEEFAEYVDIERYVQFVDALNDNLVYAYRGDLQPEPKRRWYSQFFLSSAHGPAEVDFFLSAVEKAADHAWC